MPRIVHFDIPADDPERLIKFYESVFGWKFEKWDGPMDYWLVMTGSEDEPGIDGGIGRREDGNPMVVNTIGVPDIDQFVEKVAESGGEITVPKMAIPGVGWMAYFKDPDGNLHGLMQDDPGAA